jgi:ADP-heptose:LPS heptosyltransferase
LETVQLTLPAECGTIQVMRFLLSRTDALGDLIVSLPVMERIHSRMPAAEVHWLVRPVTAPVLEGLPGVAGIHLRQGDRELAEIMGRHGFDAVLNLGHRDAQVITAARSAGIPIRVARARGRQIWQASHVLWKGRYGSGRHESMNAMDFLSPWGFQGGAPVLPELAVRAEETDQGRRELGTGDGRPVLGVVLRGSGSGAYPSQAWWDRALEVAAQAGWRPLVLSPLGEGPLPATGLRGLMARFRACAAVAGPSTGPVHLAAALGVPVLCLMGLRPHHGPDRWAPLGRRVQVLQYPGPESDLAGGMDRLDPTALLPHLARLRP